ncbi:flagellar protein E [Thermoplasma sp. Kam2015]|uniref:FlaD/FlaE family flagellar protein n=1 Tax=Thermoplasma sp. Kam2015 TaxID=2094122 RepID=UPI000D8C45A8|nr:FlaD/FlaE family flagellar protein [Thermoplasma sp. Kam2015]PYB68815.1 flagellar protein E [Thermoplasma sp. Kam2015]
MINDSLKPYLEEKLEGARKSVPGFALEELKQKIISSPIQFGKNDIDDLVSNLLKRYEQTKENSLIGKIDSIFKEISDIEKVMSSKQPESAAPQAPVEKQKRKAKLEAIGDDVVSIMVSLRWLEFLLDNYGPENTLDVLDYYESLGWISSTVKEQMMKYAKMTGVMNPAQEYKIKPSIQDHIINMLFIEKLRGEEINRDLIEALEREFRTIRKGVDELYGI